MCVGVSYLVFSIIPVYYHLVVSKRPTAPCFIILHNSCIWLSVKDLLLLVL